MKPLRLTERRPRRCRLAPDEAAWLRAHARGVIEVMPDAARHVYRLTPGGYVGTLFTPRRRVEIASRLPAANLPWLLGFEGRAAGEGWGPFDLVALVLAERLEEVARRGIHREYRERPEQGAFLVGRLDVAAQLREARRDTLHSRPDDLSAQLPCNAVPIALARRLLASPLAEAARERLASALVAWDGIEPRDGSLPDAPPGYEGLFEACGWLLASPGEGASSLLISLSRVFERLVARLVGGEPQRSFVVCPPTGRQPGLSMRPDVTQLREGRPVRAVDAKWKRLPREAVVTEDVYQAVAYGAGLGVREVVLVYPGRRRGWAFDVGPVRVRVVTLDVSGPLERCERSGRRLRRITVG